MHLGGEDIFNEIKQRLSERGYSCTTNSEKEIVRDVKERMCYAALEYDKELRSAQESPQSVEKIYELPDAKMLEVGVDRFRCVERLFRPSMFLCEAPGVHESLHSSIMRCDSELHRALFGNVVLAGGNTMFPGLVERVQKELGALAPAGLAVKVSAPPGFERKYSAWHGGSVLSSLSTFRSMCLTRELYEEHGPELAHRWFWPYSGDRKVHHWYDFSMISCR